MFPESESFIRRFSFRDDSGALLLDSVGIIFVELTKLTEIAMKPVEGMTREEQWSVFFAFGGETKYSDLIDRLTKERGEIMMANELLQTISRDENERAKYRSRRMFQMDLDHNLLASRDEGREERTLEIARNMLTKNIPIDDIVDITGLSRMIVERLKPQKI